MEVRLDRRAGARRATLFALACALLATPLAACDPAASGSDAGRADAGPLDSGVADAGTGDAGAPDAGLLPAIAEDVCDGAPPPVAVSPDGLFVAYATCGPGGGDVVVQPESGGARVVLGSGDGSSELEWSPDSAYVLFGTGGILSLRDRSAAAPAIPVGAGQIVAHAFATEPAAAGGPLLRLVAIERLAAGTLALTARDRDATGWSAVRTLRTGTLMGTLDRVTASGRFVVIEEMLAAGPTYVQVRLDDSAPADELPLDPTMLAMGAVGLGDTHGLAFTASSLVFVQLATGTTVPLADAGLPPGGGPLFVVRDAAMVNQAFFLVDGDVVRRPRDGSAPATVLAAASALDLARTPDGTRAIFASAGTLYSVPTEGTVAPTSIALGVGDPLSLDVAFAATLPELAIVSPDGTLRRALLTSPGEELVDTGVLAGSAGYAGDDALVWRTSTELRTSAATGAAHITLATGVSSWWPIPGRGALLALVPAGASSRLVRLRL